MNSYAKLVVAVLGAAQTATQAQWPSAHWSQTVTAVVTAVLVWLVPNTPEGGA